MERKDMALYCYLLRTYLNKNTIIYNRGDRVDEINPMKYIVFKDHGDALIFTDFLCGALSYDFTIQFHQLEISPLTDNKTADFHQLQDWVQTTINHYSDLHLTKENQHANDLLDSISAYYDEYILQRTGLYVIKMPASDQEIKKKLGLLNPFDSNPEEEEKWYREAEKMNPGYGSSKENYLFTLLSLLRGPNEPLLVRDFEQPVFHDSILSFSDLVLDEMTISYINEHFKNKDITFSNCSIVGKPNFNIFEHRIIHFEGMSVNLDILNHSNNDYFFDDCLLSQTKFVHLLSQKLSIRNSDIDLTQFFLTSYADRLEKIEFLELGSTNYQFLADFCPNLKQLRIDGKVSDTEPFTQFKNMTALSIGCLVGITMPIMRLTFDSEIARNRAVKRIMKDREGNLDSDTLSQLEHSRMISACALYNRITFDLDHLADWKKKFEIDQSFIDYIRSDDFIKLNQGYYYFDGNLDLFAVDKPEEISELLGNGSTFLFVGPYLAKKNPTFLVQKDSNNSKKIETSLGPLFLYCDGRPILWDDSKSKKMRMDETEYLKSILEDSNGLIENDDDEIITTFLDTIKNPEIYMSRNENGIDFLTFKFLMNEISSISFFENQQTLNTILNYLESEHKNVFPRFINLLKQYQMDSVKKEKQAIEKIYSDIRSTLYENRNILSFSELVFLYSTYVQNPYPAANPRVLKLACQKYGIPFDPTCNLDIVSQKCGYDFQKFGLSLDELLKNQRIKGQDLVLDPDTIDELLNFEPVKKKVYEKR